MSWLSVPLMLPAVLLAIADEEERSFLAEIYMRHHRLMRYTARRYLRQEADAEDAVSDALVALHGKLPLLRTLEEKALRAYIVTTVRNTALNLCIARQRAEGRSVPDGEETLAHVRDRVNVEKQVQLEDELRAVLEAMRELPGKEKTVLWMRFALSSTNEEIAEATGLSPESIRKYLSRARARLRTAVYGKGAEG